MESEEGKIVDLLSDLLVKLVINRTHARTYIAVLLCLLKADLNFTILLICIFYRYVHTKIQKLKSKGSSYVQPIFRISLTSMLIR